MDETSLSSEELIEMYRLMLLTRRFEEKSTELYAKGKLADLCHTCIGQEAITIGACFKLRKEDIIMPSLRGRGAYIAKGASVKRLLAAMYGKKSGRFMPKESAHHIGIPEIGILAGTGIVGSDIARATGAALAAKIRKTGQIAISFFGDGASNRGDFHESLNLAAIMKLPIIYICENNQYALSTPASKTVPVENISQRAASYNILGVTIDGNDVLTVYKTVQDAVKKAREGFGPTLIECKTYRWRAHCEVAPDNRSPEEIEFWKKKFGCPVQRFKEKLVSMGVLTYEKMKEIEISVEREILEAVEYAESCPYPAPEEAFTNVYAEPR
ncbi:MAG: thiamine pyrophosphate-dependent dehydrogenase E1 component subunit alpha [Candidatus Bathyarchaeia archaeon]